MCFGSDLLFIGLNCLGLLLDLLKQNTQHKNFGTVLSQFHPKFLFSLSVSHIFNFFSFVADVGIVLHVPFLVSEVFGHIFLNEITVF